MEEAEEEILHDTRAGSCCVRTLAGRQAEAERRTRTAPDRLKSLKFAIAGIMPVDGASLEVPLVAGPAVALPELLPAAAARDGAFEGAVVPDPDPEAPAPPTP